MARMRSLIGPRGCGAGGSRSGQPIGRGEPEVALQDELGGLERALDKAAPARVRLRRRRPAVAERAASCAGSRPGCGRGCSSSSRPRRMGRRSSPHTPRRTASACTGHGGSRAARCRPRRPWRRSACSRSTPGRRGAAPGGDRGGDRRERCLNAEAAPRDGAPPPSVSRREDGCASRAFSCARASRRTCGCSRAGG